MEVILTKFRTGHVELNAYLYRFDMCYTDECSFCKISEDVEHDLMHWHKYSASRLILFDRLRSLGLEELSVGVILGGGCSGHKQRAILRATAAFVKRIKWFSTYLRYWFLMTIVLIIFFELWFFRNFQEWQELLLLPYSSNTVKKKKKKTERNELWIVRSRRLFCARYTSFHICSYLLPVFHCLISVLLLTVVSSVLGSVSVLRFMVVLKQQGPLWLIQFWGWLT